MDLAFTIITKLAGSMQFSMKYILRRNAYEFVCTDPCDFQIKAGMVSNVLIHFNLCVSRSHTNIFTEDIFSFSIKLENSQY